MKRLRGVEAHHADALRIEALRDRFDARRGAAHHLVGPVVPRNAHWEAGRRRVEGLDLGRHPLRRREHGGHGARLHAGHQRPPRAREPHSVGEAEHPRRLGRGDLPDAVAQHHVRTHAHAGPERRQRALQRVEGGLLPGRVPKVARRPGPAEHDVEQGGSPHLPEHLLATIQNRSRHRLALVERATHPRPLAPLAGVREGHPGRRLRLSAAGRPGHGPQRIPQGHGVAKHDPGAAVEVASARARRPRRVGKQRFRRRPSRGVLGGLFVEPRQVPAGQFAQGGAGPRRKGQHASAAGPDRAAARRCALRPGGQRNGDGPRGPQRLGNVGGSGDRHGRPRHFRPRVLLHQGVRVSARDAEAADARDARPPGPARPLGSARGHLERQAVPLDGRIGALEVQVLRNHPATHGQRRLDQADHPGRRLQMADVGLDRTDQERPVRRAAPAVDAGHGVDLDRIAHCRAGSVGLDVVHVQRIDSGGGQRVPHDLFERRRVGNGEPHAGSPVVHHRAADHGPYPVSVPLRLFQPLQDDYPAALRAHIPVRRRVEGLALSGRGQHHRVRAQLVDAAVEDGLNAARYGKTGLALLQIRHRVVDGDHRRRAGGVHRLARTSQAEVEGHPPGGAVQVGPAEGVQAGRGIGGFFRLHDQHAVLVVADAHVDARPALPERRGIDARVLQGLPGHLQRHPLLGVEQLGLDGRDAEEGLVEVLDVVDEGPEAASLAVMGLVAEEHAPTPLAGTRRPFGDGVAAFLQQPPERLDVVGAGESARHAHDRDGFRSTGHGYSLV